MSRTRFVFDLDGTLTSCEILPLLGRELGLEDELGRLTRLTLDGVLDFPASFRLRFQMLRVLPLRRVREVIDGVALDPHLAAFVRRRKERCCVITGNLDLWVAPILERLGCRAFCSSGSLRGGELFLDGVLDKGEALRRYRKEEEERAGCSGPCGTASALSDSTDASTAPHCPAGAAFTLSGSASPLRIIAVGESAGDIPMFRQADLGIAFAGVHAPAPALLPLARHTAPDGPSLCHLLEELEREDLDAGKFDPGEGGEDF